ncbi:hypothetical protein JCM8097_005587 [Rhodosporidiobolus ruineniae]
MDFLTQPFRPPPRSPASRSPNLGDSRPRKSSYASDAPSTSSSSGPAASTSSAGSTSTPHAVFHEDHVDRFAQLRTASPLPGAEKGLPGEEPVDYPSVKKGDWKAFGKVAAQVVVWEDGTIGHLSERKLREEEGCGEWVVEGSLWVTKDDKILLIRDRDFPPLSVDRTSVLANSAHAGRRLSLSLSRTRSQSPSVRRSTTPSSADLPPIGDEHAGQPSQPVVGFFKKLVSAVSPKKGGEGTDEAGLKLSRTKSLELGKQRAKEHREELKQKQQPQKALEAMDNVGESAVADEGEGGAGAPTVTFGGVVEKRNGTPFPEYKGYPVTALHIPCTAISSVRHYPHHNPLSPVVTPSSGPAASGEPISSVFATNGAADAVGSTTQVEGLDVRPPVVEVDVRPVLQEGTEVGREKGGNRAREVTVGFVFKELLLSHEAATFHTRLLALHHASQSASLAPSTSPTLGSFGAALLRTVSGGTSASNNPPPLPPLGATGSHKGKEKETAAPASSAFEGDAPKVGRRGSLFGGFSFGGSKAADEAPSAGGDASPPARLGQRRRSSLFSFGVGGGAESEGVEPTN